MNTWISVARYRLADRYVAVISPWLVLAVNFLIVVALVIGSPPGHAVYTGARGVHREVRPAPGGGHGRGDVEYRLSRGDWLAAVGC
jgi:hypothetical protein